VPSVVGKGLSGVGGHFFASCKVFLHKLLCIFSSWGGGGGGVGKATKKGVLDTGIVLAGINKHRYNYKNSLKEEQLHGSYGRLKYRGRGVKAVQGPNVAVFVRKGS
jgi:hypothetical protein